MAQRAEFKAILARKEGMAQVFDEQGNVVPVTVLTAGPCVVTQVKTREADGYNACQMGFLDQKPQRLNKPQRVEAEKRGVPPKKVLREVRFPEPPARTVGEEIQCDWFQPGDVVDVIGRCKGRGFQGPIRAWNFTMKPKGHGGMEVRSGGSIGSKERPGRTWKGQRMPTHWGNERITSKNHPVVAVQPDSHTLLVRGSIPGPRGGLLVVRTARSRVYVPR